MTHTKGVLVAWNDCAPEGLKEYEHFYAEHLAERIAVPGFRTARRLEAVPGSGADRRFFTFYGVDTVGVLSSPAYLARLENPAPETISAMRHFRRMMRTICLNRQEDGSIEGTYAVTMRFAPEDAELAIGDDLAARIRATMAPHGAVHVRVWSAAPGQTGSTVEARARGGVDERFGFAVVIECLRAAEAETIRKHAEDAGFLQRHGLPLEPEVGVYMQLCSLRASDM